MKVVFLDVDGVLNSDLWFAQTKGKWGHMDPVLVERAKRIVQRTEAKVVLSSAWRLCYSLPEMKVLLARAGWADIPLIDATPVLCKQVRGDEIDEWLDTHFKVTSHVILDDMGWDEFYSDQPLVQTNPWFGLREMDVKRAVKMLNRRQRC